MNLQKLQLFKDADKAFYYAKENGKNKVVTNKQLKASKLKDKAKI